MTVKELMATHVYFVAPDATLAQAAALMGQRGVGFLPVCDSRGTLQGVLTDRDLLLALDPVAPDLAARRPVSDIMTARPATVAPDLSVHDAALVFAQARVRRLPVVEHDRLVGVLTVCDLAKKRIYLAEVGDIMAAMVVAPPAHRTRAKKKKTGSN